MAGFTMRLGQLFFLLCVPLATTAHRSLNHFEISTGFPPCDALSSAGLSNRILTASSSSYESRIQSWWSANARYRPWCLFQPETTHELATAISTLAAAGNGAGDWHIAVRSGGHSFPGSNNIVNGVTIDLGKMNRSWYDAPRQVASIEPGAHWVDVYTNLLNKYNVTVTGGRDGDVGVGGFLLGGGISYYSGTNGFGCDTVLNYEVVLANGTIVDANEETNTDLFRALKGGGMNFGIVTRFDVEAKPAVDLAFGHTIVALNHSDAVLDNMIAFTDGLEREPENHMFTLYKHSPDAPGIVILSVCANTQGNLQTQAFDGLSRIPAFSTSWKTTSLAAAAKGTQLKAGDKTSGATLTLLPSSRLLRYAATLHSDLVARLSTLIGPSSFLSTMILQPMPTLYLSHSERKGGNMLPPLSSNAILWTGGIGISTSDADFAIAEAEFLKMVARLREAAGKHEKLVDFVYLNYAGPSQDALGSYGTETLDSMRDVAGKYDPERFWQERVPGGFKLSRTG